MKAKRSRLLVVDASVARSAGETDHPVSSCCRNMLISIRDICHRVVMTEAIREEWRRHESRFTRKWLLSMYAKKKVPPYEPVHLDHVERVYERLSATEQDELRKDLCLIEGACAGDGIVVTRDDAIVRIWAKCHDRFELAKPILWVNPLTDGIQALDGL